MADKDKPFIHMDAAATDEQKKHKRPLLNVCPHCGAETESGFGLAGGGYGIYVSCPNDKCPGEYFDKIQVED